MLRPLDYRVWLKSKAIMLDVTGFRGDRIYAVGYPEGIHHSDCILMQFTGGIDISGSKVYQHDVIRTDYDTLAIVMWSPKSCAYEAVSKDGEYAQIMTGIEFELATIIGDVHSSPIFFNLFQEIILDGNL